MLSRVAASSAMLRLGGHYQETPSGDAPAAALGLGRLTVPSVAVDLLLVPAGRSVMGAGGEVVEIRVHGRHQVPRGMKSVNMMVPCQPTSPAA